MMMVVIKMVGNAIGPGGDNDDGRKCNRIK